MRLPFCRKYLLKPESFYPANGGVLALSARFYGKKLLWLLEGLLGTFSQRINLRVLIPFSFDQEKRNGDRQGQELRCYDGKPNTVNTQKNRQRENHNNLENQSAKKD